MITIDDFKTIALAQYLSDNMIKKILPYLKINTYKESDLVFCEGNSANRFYMLKKGKVLLEKQISEEVTITLDSIKPGKSFGWISMLGGQDFMVDAVSSQTSEILSIKSETIFELMDNDNLMGYNIMKKLLWVVNQRLTHRTKQFIKAIENYPEINKLLNKG